MIQCVFLGIKDYIKDCWHDWLLQHISKYYFIIEAKDKPRGCWYPLHRWKEGSVWHYIKQRRISAQVKREKIMNAENQFEKQLAVCRKYGKKCSFWEPIILLHLVFTLISGILDLPQTPVLIVGIVVYIPAFIRLFQYGRAVNKLGRMTE